MRTPEQLVHTRTRRSGNYALMPLEGFPPSKLPGWEAAEVFVLASPALGTEFVQVMIDLPAGEVGGAGKSETQAGVETFFYVLSGEGMLADGIADDTKLVEGRYGLLRPGVSLAVEAGSNGLKLLVLEKQYEPCVDYPEGCSYFGNVADVPAEAWADCEQSRLQTLIPDEMRFDISMNIFTFEPGYGLPIVETHVMEHGLWFLEGKGLYYLDGDWMEVEKEDFIWMGPYCPQSFYATGPTASRYLYYKNVNRGISL